jgi:hypothetical protein
LILVVVAACGGESVPLRTPQQRSADSAPAVSALRASQFVEAERHAAAALALDPGNALAAAVRAFTAYRTASTTLVKEIGMLIDKAEHFEFLDHASGRAAWTTFLAQLDAIDRDLAVVAADRRFALDLCLACVEQDWNLDGRIEEGDHELLELEYDGKGGRLADGDPRRRPTFRFDHGDAEWARAMIAFQRAGVNLVLAYRWSDLDKLFVRGMTGERLEIKLIDAGRVTRARELVLAGLDAADRCREAYLAETDDEREWVPSPRQKDHPVPLAVDATLYATWAGVIGDVRRLLRSEDGIAMREAAALIDPGIAALVPDAYVDLGAMLREPKDFVFDAKLARGRDVELLMRGLLGSGYRTKMRASSLVGRLGHVKDQLDHGEETVEHKLRYLLWLN